MGHTPSDGSTPRPWKWDQYALVRDRAGDASCSHEHPILAVTAEVFRPSKANAALIIRAVNSHDQLVAALETCRRELIAVKNGHVGGVPNSVVLLIPEAIALADDALTAAKEK